MIFKMDAPVFAHLLYITGLGSLYTELYSSDYWKYFT